MGKPEIVANEQGKALIQKLCDSALRYEGIGVLAVVGEVLQAMNTKEVTQDEDSLTSQ